MANPFEGLDAPAPTKNPFEALDAGAPHVKADPIGPPAPPADPPPQPRGAVKDFFTSANRGLVDATADNIGMMHDVPRAIDHGVRWGVSKVLEHLGVMSPEQGDFMRNGRQYDKEGNLVYDRNAPDSPFHHTSADEYRSTLRGAASAIGINTDDPQSKAGEYGHTVGALLPYFLNPAGGEASLTERLLPATAQKAIEEHVPSVVREVGKAATTDLPRAVAPGITSQAAHDVAKDTPLETTATVLGAGLPSAAEQLITKPALRVLTDIANPKTKMLAGRSADELSNAQTILDNSREPGMSPVTVPEAVQQASNGASRLGDVQRVVEQSTAGGPALKDFYAQRADKNAVMRDKLLDGISPPVADPQLVPQDVQKAAQGVTSASPEATRLRAADRALGAPITAEEAGNTVRADLQQTYDRREGMRNALGDQDYDAARAADYTTNGAAANPVQVQSVITRVDDLLRDAKGETARSLDGVRATLFNRDGVPDMSVRGLHNARTELAARVQDAERAGDTARAAVLREVQGRLDDALEAVPPYGQARRNFAAASEPLEPFSEDRTAGKIIQRDEFDRDYKMPAEKVAGTITRGPTAADQFLAAATNLPGSQEVVSRFFAQGLKHAAQDAKGMVNVDKLAELMHQNQELLQRFPDAERQLLELRGARAAYSKVQGSPIGQIAEASDPTSITSKLFHPTKSLTGSAGAVGATIRAVEAYAPGVGAALVRTHLEDAFNTAAKDLASGPNLSGGALFRRNVIGNEAERAIMHEALKALPDGAIRAQAFDKFMEVWAAQGRHQAMGSPTAQNAQIAHDLQGSGSIPGTLGRAGSTLASPAKWATFIGDSYRDWMANHNAAQLADHFVNGNISDLSPLPRGPSLSDRSRRFSGVLGRAAIAYANGSTQSKRDRRIGASP